MDPRRALPSVDRIVSRLTGLPHALLADAAREAIADARVTIATGGDVDEEAVFRDAARRVEGLQGARLRPVVNATGVLLHTNLGRAPVAADALADAARVGGSYSNLEFDLATGRRGSRDAHAGALLARACGAEAGLVVNNNAAAVLLALAALARGRGRRGVAGRAGRDRRRLPRAGDHGRVGLSAGRGRHHQPHPSRRLRTRRWARTSRWSSRCTRRITG